MTLWAFPIITTLWIIVDRIEGDYAIVEWNNLSLSALHLSVLPREIQEGSRIRLTFHPSPLGDWYAVHTDPSILQGTYPLVIPIKDAVCAGLYYQFTFSVE